MLKKERISCILHPFYLISELKISLQAPTLEIRAAHIYRKSFWLVSISMIN